MSDIAQLQAELDTQKALVRELVRARTGLTDELQFSGDADYATATDLLAVDDLPERDITIRRWTKAGKSLKLRVRALDLDQQERIDIESLIKHEKTEEWVRSGAIYAAATLREAVIVPTLDDAKAHLMRKHNPVIIGELVRFIWTLSALDDAFLEKLVALDDPPTPHATELSEPGE